MENDIALMASGYVLARIGVLAAFAYLIYRVLRPQPKQARVRSQSSYARERSQVGRYDR